MDTKGKSSRGFYHAIGLITLTPEKLAPAVVSHFPHKNVKFTKEKRSKKEKVVIVLIAT